MDHNGNLADLVTAAARRGPDHLAFVDPVRGHFLSWAGFSAAMNAEAARLGRAGVQPGDRVLVRLRQGIPLCVALLGALRAGAVVVPAGTESTERELAVVLADCAPAAVVAERDDRVVTAVVAAVGDGSPAVVLAPPVYEAAGPAGTEPGPSGTAPTGQSPVEQSPVEQSPAEQAPAQRGGEDLAVLGYTSGTTGVPRGVMLTHRALLANRAQSGSLRPIPISPADRVLLHLPLFHMYGLGAGLLQVCWAGATGVLVDRVDPEEVLSAIERERVTVVAGVPSMFRVLLELPAERLREGLATVRLCTAGGAPLAPDLLRRFNQVTGLELFEGYGLTEAGPVLTTALVSGKPKPGSAGRPLPGVELRLVDASTGEPLSGSDDDQDDDELGSGGDGYDTGLVSVRGPNLFSGYWPDGADGPDEEGWFRTSDVGYLDSDGDLHLVDRANDLIIVNGFNVYPHEIEQVLAENEAIAEAAVVGIPDERTGEAVMAVLVLRAGASLTVDDVRAHCAAGLARFKVPTVVEFVDSLPRSATGKITRAALRAVRGAGRQ
ncbi:MAG TPA: AMP-binding protein [Pseudonocardia sp.]|nr:AMP-binding protein [Pseudonocardia sp.]